jgi:hypothetical protein
VGVAGKVEGEVPFEVESLLLRWCLSYGLLSDLSFGCCGLSGPGFRGNLPSELLHAPGRPDWLFIEAGHGLH